jgi:hypothetical protein
MTYGETADDFPGLRDQKFTKRVPDFGILWTYGRLKLRL